MPKSKWDAPRTDDGLTELMIVASKGSMQTAKQLLAEGATVDKRSKNGLTALSFAIAANRPDMMQLLLARGVSPQSRDAFGNTMLIWAALNGSLDCVKSLLSKESEYKLLNAVNSSGDNVLAAAASENKLDVCAYLVPLFTTEERGMTVLKALMDKQRVDKEDAARKAQQLQIVRNLAATGVDLNAGLAKDPDYSILMLAIANEDREMMLDILACGADVNATTALGESPAFMAAFSGKLKCLQILVSKGANIECKNKAEGKTPLLAASMQGNTDCVAYLLKAGANIDALDNWGNSALRAAVSGNHKATAELLVANGHKVAPSIGAHVKEESMQTFLQRGLEAQETARAARAAALFASREQARVQEIVPAANGGAGFSAAETEASDSDRVELDEVQWKDLTIHSLLGDGTSGCVYAGKLGPNTVAVKVMQPAPLRRAGMEDPAQLVHILTGVQESFLKTIMQEAELQNGQFHENIIGIFGWSKIPLIDGSFSIALVMEHAARGSLSDHLLAMPDTPTPTRLQWLLKIADGLNYLHTNKVVHADLKAGNVLLTDTLVAKLCDFGLSRVRNATRSIGASTTRRMVVDRHIGSLLWMAPEQFWDDKRDGPTEPTFETDVYSFGITAWEILTGLQPYDKEYPFGVQQVPFVVYKGRRPNMRDLPADTPAGIRELLEACWHVDRNKRPTMKQVLAVMEHECAAFGGAAI